MSLQRTEIDGRPVWVGELDNGMLKLVYDDGEIAFAVPHDDTQKFNPWHDLMGLFSSGPGAGAGAPSHGSTGSVTASETTINELINPSVLAAQREAVQYYTDEGYLTINNWLREGEAPPAVLAEENRSTIRHLDSLLGSASLDKDTTVYRGISKAGAKRFDEALANGDTTFVDRGFLSTTRDEHYAEVFAASIKHSNAVVDIVLPKGSHALDVATWSSSPDEQETLVQRGSVFKIESKTFDNDTNAPIYHVRLVPGQQQLDLPFGKRKYGSDNKYVWQGHELVFLTNKYNHEHDPHTGEFASSGDGGAGVNQVGGAPLTPWSDHPTDIAGWAKVEGQKPDLVEPPFHLDHGERTASGVVIQEPDGRVWLVHPANQFGGYNATFPKGGVEPGLSMQANAIKEAYEESGLKVRITGYARDVERTTSKTRYYFAERVGGNPTDHGWETDHVSLVAPGKLSSVADHPIDQPLIEQIRNLKKYNHAHDPKSGEFASAGDTGPVVFHGTSEAMLKSIQEKGLVPQGGTGADTWLHGQKWSTEIAGRPASVYFAGDPRTAQRFAELAAQTTGSTPVVLPIHLTNAEAAQMVWDEQASRPAHMRVASAIPASQIGTPAVGMEAIDKLTRFYDSNWEDLAVGEDQTNAGMRPSETLLPVTSGNTVDRIMRGTYKVIGKRLIYAVILIDPVAKYNHAHDPHSGEFASAEGGRSGDASSPSDPRFTASRPLTKEEKLSVGFYTATTGYREINAALRSGLMTNTPEETQAHAKNLASAIDVHTVNEPLTVFRGIRNDGLISKFNEAVVSGDNNEFVDKGFPSTSFSQHVALEFTNQIKITSARGGEDSTQYMMRITIPKGAHALPASALGLGARDEDEVILQRGSRFRVTKRNDEGFQVVYDAELIR
jgi:8-oxo-dGTP pyrophosphatase MutT (NUDIX family)